MAESGMTSPQNTNSGSLPTIIRVNNEREARYEADLHGLHPHKWRYIGTREKLMGLEFREGDEKTYYINYDIPKFEIDLRMR